MRKIQTLTGLMLVHVVMPDDTGLCGKALTGVESDEPPNCRVCYPRLADPIEGMEPADQMDEFHRAFHRQRVEASLRAAGRPVPTRWQPELGW